MQAEYELWRAKKLVDLNRVEIIYPQTIPKNWDFDLVKK